MKTYNKMEDLADEHDIRGGQTVRADYARKLKRELNEAIERQHKCLLIGKHDWQKENDALRIQLKELTGRFLAMKHAAKKDQKPEVASRDLSRP